MKHMNRLTSAFRHRDNNAWEINREAGRWSSRNPKIKYWVPNEGLNDSSRGKCKNNNAAVRCQGDTT